MFFIKLLTEENVKYCTNAIKKLKYKDGSFTQPLNKVYNVKQNQEILGVPENVRKYLIDIFYNHDFIDSVYCPNRISVNFYNKYQKDDFYDLHVDSFRATPKSNNVYFDYGFSINLTDKYEGGEFFLQTEVGPMSFKLASGEAAVFPIIYPHGVNKVTSGIRENILGWFSSNVSYEQSFILKNLYDVQAHLKGKNKEKFVQTTLVQSYLKKAWGK
jgi:predicted 2-oxoglutarate/Fe(II)-dependent dioxygenase YbiX|tara:strand:- start:5353 stop:5997 length:645 start_codon:yes stop_codon:yes gene_type:complete